MTNQEEQNNLILSQEEEKEKNSEIQEYKEESGPHETTKFIRGNEIYYVCDRCKKEVKQSDVMLSNKGKHREYAYCPECTKILYPNYRKIQFYNPNPIMTNIMHEALARKEYRR